MESNKSVVFHKDGSVELSGGQVLTGVHRAGTCAGEHCPLHKPSNHDMRDMILTYNGTSFVRVDSSLPHGMSVDPDDYILNKDGSAIAQNAAKCLTCGFVVESTHRHHAASCSCGSLTVDGGQAYLRRSFSGNFEDETITTTIDGDVLLTTKGISFRQR